MQHHAAVASAQQQRGLVHPGAMEYHHHRQYVDSRMIPPGNKAWHYMGYPIDMRHMPADVHRMQMPVVQGAMPAGVALSPGSGVSPVLALEVQARPLGRAPETEGLQSWCVSAGAPATGAQWKPAANGAAPTKYLTIFPRRKAGQLKRDVENAAPVQLTLEMLHEIAHVPLIVAAKKLGISKTALKNACRSLGLERWPFRRNVQSAKRRSQGGADAAQDSASDEDEDEDGQDAMPPGHGLPKPVGTAQEHVDSVAFNDMGFLQQPCPGGGFSPVAAGLAPHFMPGAAMHAPAHHGLAMARQMHPQQQQQHLPRDVYGLAAHAHARLAEAAQPRAALLPEKQALPSAHAAHAGHAAHTQQPVRGRPGPGPCYEHGYALGPAEMSQLVTHAVAMPPAAYAAPAGRRGPAPLPAGYESAALHGAQGCRPSADGAGSSALSAGGAGGAPDEDAGAGAQLDGAHAGHRAGSGSEGSPPRSDASGEEGAAYDTNSSKSMAGSESSGSGVARGASAASCATTVAGAWGALRGKAPPHHGAMPPSGGAPVPGSAADAIPRGMPPQEHGRGAAALGDEGYLSSFSSCVTDDASDPRHSSPGSEDYSGWWGSIHMESQMAHPAAAVGAPTFQ